MVPIQRPQMPSLVTRGSSRPPLPQGTNDHPKGGSNSRGTFQGPAEPLQESQLGSEHSALTPPSRQRLFSYRPGSLTAWSHTVISREAQGSSGWLLRLSPR